MEEVIDLRPYLQIIIRNTKWIVSTAFIFAIVTFFVIRSSPEIYEASALIIILGESDIFQFDPRIQTIPGNEPNNALPELAISSNLLLELLESDTLSGSGIETLDDLQKILQAETGSDRSLIRLIVKNADRSLAARIANRWAELFVNQANSIYGTQSDEKVLFFQEQLSQSKTELETAESNLIEFQQINRTDIISNTLAFYNEEQSLHLNNQQSLVRLAQDTEQLRNQLTDIPANTPISFSEQLTALNMQLEAYNSDATVPIFVQLDQGFDLIGSTRNEQVAFLDRLTDLLQFKLTIVENRLDTLEPQILDLQKEWQEAVVENDRLTRNRTIAEETYISLARKVQEEQITSQDTDTGFRLVSPAAIPDKPEGRRTLFFTTLAGFAGLMISTMIILTTAWWRQEEI